MTGGFESIDNAKKLESRASWERMVFEPADVDVSKLETYLESVFDVQGWKRNSGAVKALEELRQVGGKPRVWDEQHDTIHIEQPPDHDAGIAGVRSALSMRSAAS